MKNSQFLLLLAVVAAGQIATILMLPEPPKALPSGELRELRRDLLNAIAQSRATPVGVENRSADPQPPVTQPSAPPETNNDRAVDSVDRTDTMTADPGVRAAALSQSNDIVQRALVAGQWSAADQSAMRRQLLFVPPEERLEIVLKVHRALERNQLRLEPGVLPPM